MKIKSIVGSSTAALLLIVFYGLGARVASRNAMGQAAKTIAELPDTPVSNQLRRFLTASARGDERELRAFFGSTFVDAALRERTAEDRFLAAVFFAHTYGPGYEVVRVSKSDETSINVLARANLTELWIAIIAVVEPTPPYRFVTLEVRPHAIPAFAFGTRALPDAQVRSRVTAYLQRLAKADLISGTVLVAHNGRSILRQSYGVANKTFNIPNQIDTKFNLASLGKMFTAVAIAQLVEAGKLSYDDPIGKLLPEYPNQEFARSATVRMLLLHRSGLGSFWNNEQYARTKDTLRTVPSYMALFMNEALTSVPGEKFQYSNSGFVILGAIIERLSGETFYDYVGAHIFRPARMPNSAYFERDQIVPNVATGYTFRSFSGGISRQQHTNESSLPARGSPAGGAYSTVDDLGHFAEALRRHRLLGAEAVAGMLKGQEEDARPGVMHAYGFFDETVNSRHIISQNGGFPGANTVIDLYTQEELGYTVIVLSNYDGPGAIAVSTKLRELLAVNASTHIQ
jgi:CubicO group peptidase (beta-lactamase class C family)